MRAYIIKIANREGVGAVERKERFTHKDIYNFGGDIQDGDPVFIYLGGDRSRISWDQGLRAVGRVVAAPYDQGYDPSKPRNFKIDIDPKHLLQSPIPPKKSKIHPRLAAALYDVPYVGANHFPNQAIASVRGDKELKGITELYLEQDPLALGILREIGLPVEGEQLTNSNRDSLLPIDSIDGIVESFQEACKNAGLIISHEISLRFIASLLTKPFLILTGLAGSGKTKLAQAFAQWLTMEAVSLIDPFVEGAEIPSDRISYFVEDSDRLSVTFRNKAIDADSTRVMLPRELIGEWVEVIKSKGFDAKTPAREIRESVKDNSSFSSNLNSFETHLKAAALTVINAELSPAKVDKEYEVVAVGSNWDSSENILGYPDDLRRETKGYSKPSNGALDLIIRAQKSENRDRPFFLILDEMNLSHVERYFADVLSAIESGEPMNLHDGEGSWGEHRDVPGRLFLPPNLFIIGTVNIDETTYMFSPKVLDRANVIEFRAEREALEAFFDTPRFVDLRGLAGKGAQYSHAFVKSSAERASSITQIVRESSSGLMHVIAENELVGDGEELVSQKLKEDLLVLFDRLENAGSEFGFRTANEIQCFVGMFVAIAGKGALYKDALDAQVLQKLLPKLHGSVRKLDPVLEILLEVCGPDRLNLQRTCDKLERMRRNLRSNGFTSFAEA